MPHYARPYAHHKHLPYSHEPWKSLYVFQRLLTTITLVPFWVFYYSLLPRNYRPRSSWSLQQIINVKFTRRIYKITEVAGVTWGTRDPESEPPAASLSETRFEWTEPLAQNLRTGIVVGEVPFKKVGCYIWPKDVPHIVKACKSPIDEHHQSLPPLASRPSDDLESAAGEIPLIGIFMHGGGYCHMSAHESARTSRIPRRLIKDKILTEVYSVEYRLLQHAPFPGVIQDAAAVYADVVRRFNHGKPGSKRRNCRIILIGDSSGGNLALALARWIRDEGTLPMPDGLLLLSPSCDTSHALPETHSSYIPRPNAATDYLIDTPEPRALLQRTFLGFHHAHPTSIKEEQRLMGVVHSEYISPCSPRVLQRWGHPVKQDADGAGGEEFREAMMDAGEVLRVTRDPTNLEPDKGSPYRNTSKFGKLFEGFPRTLIVVGDAERLVKEVRSLQDAMERDGVDVRTEWLKDAVHDVLIMGNGWWDPKAVGHGWKAIKEWGGEF